MIDDGVRDLPVFEDGELVGMVSDRDVRAAVGDRGSALLGIVSYVDVIRGWASHRPA